MVNHGYPWYQNIGFRDQKGTEKETKIAPSFLIKLSSKEITIPGPKYKIPGPKYRISGPKRDQKRDKNRSVIPSKASHQGN